MFCSEGGFFRAELHFPKDYPQKPPKMKFTSEMWHPNGKRGLVAYPIEYQHSPPDELNCLTVNTIK